MRALLSRASAFRADTAAVAALEFALLLPFLVLTIFGSWEMANYINAVNKVDRSAQTLATIMGRAPDVSAINAGTIPFRAAMSVGEPFNLYANGRTIVTLVVNRQNNNDNDPIIYGQWGYGLMTAASHVGTGNGSAATIPNGVAPDGRMAFVVECFYTYRPTVWPLFGGGGGSLLTNTIYRSAFYLPRFSAMPP